MAEQVFEGNDALHQIPSRPNREHANPLPEGDVSSPANTVTTPQVHEGADPARAAMGWIE